MTPATSKTLDSAAATKSAQTILERSGQELIVYHLRCARTANGLSHYYMYGDLTPEETLL